MANATISVEVIDDAIGEQIETINVTLSPGAYSIDGAGTAGLAVYDDEAVVSIEAIPDSLAEDGLQSGDFVFNRTGSPGW